MLGSGTQRYMVPRPKRSVGLGLIAVLVTFFTVQHWGQLNPGYRLADSRDADCHAKPNTKLSYTTQPHIADRNVLR